MTAARGVIGAVVDFSNSERDEQAKTLKRSLEIPQTLGDHVANRAGFRGARVMSVTVHSYSHLTLNFCWIDESCRNNNTLIYKQN